MLSTDDEINSWWRVPITSIDFLSPYSSVNEGIAMAKVVVVKSCLNMANLGSTYIISLRLNFLSDDTKYENPAFGKFSSMIIWIAL